MQEFKNYLLIKITETENSFSVSYDRYVQVYTIFLPLFKKNGLLILPFEHETNLPKYVKNPRYYSSNFVQIVALVVDIILFSLQYS